MRVLPFEAKLQFVSGIMMRCMDNGSAEGVRKGRLICNQSVAYTRPLGAYILLQMGY